MREQVRRALRADAARARDLVRGVAAQRDEVHDLLRVDPVALAHLGRPDASRRLSARHGLQDRRVGARELERVSIGRGDERLASGGLLGRDRRGEEVVRLVSRALPVRDSPRVEEPGHEVELLEQLGVELAAATGTPSNSTCR